MKEQEIRFLIDDCLVHPNPWMCLWAVASCYKRTYHTREEIISFLTKYKQELLNEDKQEEAGHIEEALGFFEGKFGEELRL